MKPGAAVRVTWVDSQTTYGWHHADTDGPALIESVGWLVASTPDYVTLSTSRGPSGCYVDQLTIPRCAIRRLRRP